jgi:hypothetical protein
MPAVAAVVRESSRLQRIAQLMHHGYLSTMTAPEPVRFRWLACAEPRIAASSDRDELGKPSSHEQTT